ncbi:hypothetical protein [Xenorhabdus doucetiae]|uniref:Uncharacterized protein n=1 Tax=Xenorhabdus doucetiae TaxID=351671 RepID=A0ABY3NQS5_9GAMM|nr:MULTISPECIES: hypothetical protein [Xenorhabdus]MBD2798424.1 hypothetical protein [Xenorhabdus sp. 18]TYP04908.1 hypothetical protein LY16_02150 [Xenorhabdus doucetiae]
MLSSAHSKLEARLLPEDFLVPQGNHLNPTGSLFALPLEAASAPEPSGDTDTLLF